jgi:hypothetical protein
LLVLSKRISSKPQQPTAVQLAYLRFDVLGLQPGTLKQLVIDKLKQIELCKQRLKWLRSLCNLPF